ncbi:MAG: DUF2829 domain-containing protein [Sphaerochaetaceae bacterium]
MSRYRKKPVVVDACQVAIKEGALIVMDAPLWLPPPTQDNGVGDMEKPYIVKRNGKFLISTLEGDMEISNGDYIIRGVQGELYPCKPDIFDVTYKKCNAEEVAIIPEIIDFGTALRFCKYKGYKVARKGWNGKGMFVYYVPAEKFKTLTAVAKEEFGDEVQYNPYLAIKTVQGTVSTWVPSINDVLAEDWEIIQEA